MTVSFTLPSLIDPKEVREALSILLSPQGAHEIRGLSRTEGGNAYVRSRAVKATDLDRAVGVIQELGDSRGVYYTLNPVRADLGDHAAKVRDVLSRYWFLIDVDRRKTEGVDIMATQEEKDQVFLVADKIIGWLSSEGWPSPVMIDSGNGCHLLYRIDLPSNDLTRILLSRALKALATRFDNEHVTIDQKVFDASRISKLPGTWVRKGSDVSPRQWRIAKLLWYPETREVVSVELLEALSHQGKVHPAEEPTPDPWTMVYEAPPDKVEGYVKSAVDRELAKVVLSNPGNRNNALNEAAFAIGQFVGGKFVGRTQAEKDLANAARRTGLGDFEAERTIKSGLDAGEQKPRVLPHSITMGAQRNGTHKTPTYAPGQRLIILASQVKPRKVEWLWPNRIPLGKLTTFAGWGGLGKSFVTMDLAARISAGAEIPGLAGECFEVGNVLILNTEDDPEDTSVPRLIEAGADLKRIAFARSEVLGKFTLADLQTLDAMCNQLGSVRFLIIDPATSFLGGVNDHHNSELRSLLTPLSLWVGTRMCGTSLVTHVTKPQASKVEAMARVMGSVAWVNAVRAAVMFSKDPDDPARRLFIPFKSNNAPEQKGLAYKIVGTPELAKVEWLGEVDTTADDAVNQTKSTSAAEDAADWVTSMFRMQRVWESNELRRLGLAAGHSANALFKSNEVKALPITKQPYTHPDGRTIWTWTAKYGWPPIVPTESPESPKNDMETSF